jgi:hypothetical protein
MELQWETQGEAHKALRDANSQVPNDDSAIRGQRISNSQRCKIIFFWS